MNLTCPTAVEDHRAAPDGGAMVAVMSAAGALQQQLEAALVTVGLSVSKFDALDQLTRAGEPLMLGALAGKLQCVRSNVTQLVDRLEAEGLVKRTACPDDRRAVRAQVTALGAERHAAGAAVIRAVQGEIAGRIDPVDRERLVQLLAAVVG